MNKPITGHINPWSIKYYEREGVFSIVGICEVVTENAHGIRSSFAGRTIRTSVVRYLNLEDKIVETLNSRYTLGAFEPGLMEAI